MFSFRNVSYAYEGRPSAVDNLTFSISPGEWVALMGANGCGKSTVARLACGLLQPSQGEISGGPVGFVAQDPEANIVGDTVGEDVAFGPAQAASPEDVLRRVDESLALVGLSGFQSRSMVSLSGGELQRVAVAAALAANVRFLVLDEPTSHLPRPDGHAFCRHLRSAASKRSIGVLYVTHHPQEAMLADRVMVLAGGRLALEGKPERILFREALLKDLGVRPDAALCLHRILQDRVGADPGEAAPAGEGFERLVERVCSALKACS